MKILLVDGDAERGGAVARVPAGDPGLTVLRLRPRESLAEAAASLTPDVVLVDLAHPDHDALEGIRGVAALNSCPVVLFVDEDHPGFMEEAINAGVSSYHVMGMPLDVKPILHAAIALFRRHQQVRDDLKDAESRLRERTVIDKAKAILIKQHRLSEPEAYKWLRRSAMSSARRIADVASDLIKDLEGSAK